MKASCRSLLIFTDVGVKSNESFCLIYGALEGYFMYISLLLDALNNLINFDSIQ